MLPKVLFGAKINAGRLACSITLAIVNVLPEPVTPNKTCSCLLFLRFLSNFLIASGWSPLG